MAIQLSILSGTLHSRQGARYWILIPIFTLIYGPVLLFVRFVGTWAGLVQVRTLRRKEDRLEHAGLDGFVGRAAGDPVGSRTGSVDREAVLSAVS
jgi:hypothetical protein